MANALIAAYRNNILGLDGFTNVQLDVDTIKAMFVDNADDTAVVGDDGIDDILSAARVPAIASCPTLGSKTIGTVATGTFDAADSLLTALTGDQVEQLIVFKDTGVEATSLILAIYDTFTSGMPLTPNGGDVTIQWNASGLWQV